MTHPSDSLLHPIHGVAAEDIAAELGHSTGARIGALERMVDRILRYLVLRIRAFRGIQILTGPDAGALVKPDGNGVIGIECQSETGTIQQRHRGIRLFVRREHLRHDFRQGLTHRRLSERLEEPGLGADEAHVPGERLDDHRGDL